MNTKDLIAQADNRIDSYNIKELTVAGFLPKKGLYFPAIFYPPVPMYPAAKEDNLLKDCPAPGEPLALYIHIPFCRSHCRYCHWVVSIGNTEAEMDEYLAYLEKEVILYKKKLGLSVIRPSSILIGGGTPSIFNPAQTARLLRCLNTKFDLSRCRQITCELEPDTILGKTGLEKLKIMKDGGINRVSLGVQSFNDAILKRICRNHNAKQAEDAIRQIKRSRIESLSLDLIYGLPGMTEKIWIETLLKAHSLNVDAYQLYRLRIVPHGARTGAINKDFKDHPEIFPGVGQIYRMKEIGIILAAQKGFKEVSRRVFAKSEKHNSEYLKDHTIRLSDVIGFGVSSWTNLSDRFFISTGKGIKEYYSYIDRSKLPISRGKIRNKDDRMRWAISLPLKHSGVSKRLFLGKTGENLNKVFGEKIESLKNFGLLDENDNCLKLTQKGGFFADETVIQFYNRIYLPFPASSYSRGKLNPFTHFSP